MKNTVKTIPTNDSVDAYIASIEDIPRRNDCITLLDIMQEITHEPPVLWGSSIVGFGTLHYKYASGREGDTVIVGFSARKQALVLYGVIFYEQNLDKLEQLGTCTAGKGCLYIKRLSDINIDILRDMIKIAYANRHTLDSQ